jgi:dTDP-4-amino-4,6-dideoxygalactose transaminase
MYKGNVTEVPLLDLKAQYRPLKKELDEALIKTAESQYFILGKEVETLEKNLADYLEVKHAIGVTSGTDALLIALMAIDLKPGDKVIMPTYSFFATAGVVARMNADSIFTEVESSTFNMKTDDLEKYYTKDVKAIMPVHLFGQSANMDPIIEFAKKHNIYVIEDCAQAIGTRYKNGKRVGSIGDIGCYSFFPSKNLGCFGDAGLVVTNNDELGEKLKLLRVHGAKQRYFHEIIGGNFRIDAIQAAVLNVKLPHLDSWSKKRAENAHLYKKLFKEYGLSKDENAESFDNDNKVILPKEVYKNSGVSHNHIFNQFKIFVEGRDGLEKHLAANKIGCAIYYPVPFHEQKCFEKLGYKKGDFPIAEFCADHCLALPIYPELTPDMQEYVVSKIAEYIKK